MKKIGVIGVGKLGVCFALNAERKGFHVIGVDVNPDIVADINSRHISTDEPLVKKFLADANQFEASTSLQSIIDDDISLLFLFVATPSLADGGYDHSQIDRIASQLIELGVRNNPIQLIVGCTTMPGYCNLLAEQVLPYNYLVSYCPEFIAQGSIMRNQVMPDQVLIGEATHESGNTIEQFYSHFCNNSPVFCRMDRISAEIAKIATNCFLTTKISFANSIGDLAVKAGANPEKILAAIGSDSRIGSRYLGYGYGFGGPCFPRDNRALGKFADESGYELLLSKATDEVNRRHLDFQVQQALDNTDETITFDYVSYKTDSTIIEESQQLALALRLARAGKTVVIRERTTIIRFLEKEYPGLFIFEEASQEI
jgi:UDPglucose 6-dehydrogenase